MDTNIANGPDSRGVLDALKDDISDLPRGEWLETLEEFAEQSGYFTTLGQDHCAAFTEASSKLLITFETYESISERSENGFPLGLNLSLTHGWSHLGLIAHSSDPQAPWFRPKDVIAYFDRLTEDGFFDEYDQIVFYGAGPCGYAAATFSVSAPGATVIAVSPQATLDTRLSSWDTRFPQTRRMDFNSRYGFAPDMIDAADRALVLYDPSVDADAMHAALFARSHVTLRPCSHFGADPEFEMLEMGIIAPLLNAALNKDLSERSITKTLRKRRTNRGYLRRLLSQISVEDQPYRASLLCNHVLKEFDGRRFSNTFKNAQIILNAQGRHNPWADDA